MYSDSHRQVTWYRFSGRDFQFSVIIWITFIHECLTLRCLILHFGSSANNHYCIIRKMNQFARSTLIWWFIPRIYYLGRYKMGHLKTEHFLLNSCTNFCIFCKQQNLISPSVLICNKNLVWPSGILHGQACSIELCMQLESRNWTWFNFLEAGKIY